MSKKDSLLEEYYRIHKKDLTETTSRLLEMHISQTLSNKEIASQLKQSPSSTREKLAKAIYELKKIAADPGYLQAREILYGKKDK